MRMLSTKGLGNMSEVTELAPGRLGCQALQRAGNAKWLIGRTATVSLARGPDRCVDGGTLGEKL